ncbi:hypothetical protein GKC30_11765 [Pseudodesulfovibrio sp. F-1]|uniref:Uncharacterized protein n=1 Tax=Pseudodesulfovibrio alkaliphilus TaxID=2661613 RepID=A0A7K1KR31_9BACT|nr:hypothetical protein [Pseudodesulfovibrio alkaliphilus]MUM78311.1 hypothetical protein [Pseudodesulfovibrio alkaliphilus]
MHISTDTLASQTWGTSTRPARGLVRTVTDEAMTLESEKTEEELQLGSSNIAPRKQLSEEEEQRVLYLKNLLAQILTMSEGQPSDEQKTRIREIEKELEKITGVKMQSSLSNATEKLPNKTAGARRRDEEEEERRKRERQARGIDPKELEHTAAQNLAGLTSAANQSTQGLKMMQSAGSATYQAVAAIGLSPGDELRTGLSLKA